MRPLIAAKSESIAMLAKEIGKIDRAQFVLGQQDCSESPDGGHTLLVAWRKKNDASQATFHPIPAVGLCPGGHNGIARH